MDSRYKTNHEDLEKVVSSYLKQELNVNLSSFKIENVDLYNDDFIIELKVSLTPRKLPKDFMLRLVSFTAKAIRESGETRYPIVRPLLSRGQKVAA